MSNINDECKRFIAKDEEGFQNYEFKHAQFLVDLLPELKSGKVKKFLEDFILTREFRFQGSTRNLKREKKTLTSLYQKLFIRDPQNFLHCWPSQ